MWAIVLHRVRVRPVAATASSRLSVSLRRRHEDPSGAHRGRLLEPGQGEGAVVRALRPDHLREEVDGQVLLLRLRAGYVRMLLRVWQGSGSGVRRPVGVARALRAWPGVSLPRGAEGRRLAALLPERPPGALRQHQHHHFGQDQRLFLVDFLLHPEYDHGRGLVAASYPLNLLFVLSFSSSPSLLSLAPLPFPFLNAQQPTLSSVFCLPFCFCFKIVCLIIVLFSCQSISFPIRHLLYIYFCFAKTIVNTANVILILGI